MDSTEVTAGSGAGARVLGDGTIALAYSGEMTVIWKFEIYSGTGTIGGVDYIVQATYSVDLQRAAITLYEAADNPDTDTIDLENLSYSGGTTLDGGYSGSGAYFTGGLKDIGGGTFTAAKS